MDKLIIALIVLVFTFVGNVLAYRMNVDYGHSQQRYQLVVEKTGEVWKGIVNYRTYLDKVSKVEFGGFINSSTNTKQYSEDLMKAHAEALQAKQHLNKIVDDNEFYIGTELTEEASLYINYLDGYYKQRQQIYYSREKPSAFEMKEFQDTQKLLDQAGSHLTARGAYVLSDG